MNQKLENQIISVAYGDANIWQKIKIMFLAKKNKDVAKLLSEYSKTAESVKKLTVNFPDGILENLNVQPSKTKPVKSSMAPAFSFILNRPVLSAATVTAVLVIVLVLLFSGRSQNNYGYTEAQIKLADKQVKQTLALVSNVFNETERTLEKDVFVNKVGRPLSQSVEIVNNLFNGGSRNEKLN